MRRYKFLEILPIVALFSACTANTNVDNDWQTLVVGSYTDSGATGIASYRFNQSTGEFTALDSVVSSNPSYFAFSESGRYLYAVNENDTDNSAISSFEFDKTSGKISFISSVATESSAPCYLNISDNRAVAANYFGGDISIAGIDTATGGLTKLISKQEFSGEDTPNVSHLHTAYTTPDGEQIIATDLGKDRLYIYNRADILSAECGEDIPYTTFKVAEGTGPRHIAISSDSKYIYVLGELGGDITIIERKNGELNQISTIVADSLNASGSADIHISNDGRYLYATNRLKGDGIVHFKIKDGGSKLERVSFNPTGRHPRNFIITPNDKFLLVASRDDNRIDIFERDIETGVLSSTNMAILLKKPVCVKFAP